MRTVGALLVLIGLCLHSIPGITQERFNSGPYKGFLKEQPELNKTELPKPFIVRLVKGTIHYSGERPLSGAVFGIRDRDGKVRSATTDERGMFEIANVLPGTYEFKVTKNEFESVVGTVVVSRAASNQKYIRVQLQLGT